MRQIMSAIYLCAEMKKLPGLLKTDLAMVPLFIIVAVSGIKYHLSGHYGTEDAICFWRIIHATASILFAMLMGTHIWQHRKWFKAIVKSKIRSKYTNCALALIASFETVTGLILIISGQPLLGHVHWIGGLMLIVLTLLHIVPRIKVLAATLRR